MLLRYELRGTFGLRGNSFLQPGHVVRPAMSGSVSRVNTPCGAWPRLESAADKPRHRMSGGSVPSGWEAKSGTDADKLPQCGRRWRRPSSRDLLIGRPRPSVRTGPASRPSRSEPQTWSPWMSVVVRGWPRGLAPRMAPGSRSCSLIRSRSHALRVGSVASMSDCAAKSCPRTCVAVHGLPVCRLLDSPHAETVTPRTPAG